MTPTEHIDSAERRALPPPAGAAAGPGWGWLAVLLSVALAASGCDSDGDDHPASGAARATATASAAGAQPGRFPLPPRRPFDPNPLGLPERSVTIAKDTAVYAPSRQALESAGLGSSLVLRRVAAVGVEGGTVLVQAGRRAPYAVHPGYLVVPGSGRLRRGGYALVDHRGRLRHALIVAFTRERVTVRYTDLGRRGGEVKLPRRLVAPQRSGLASGSYAVQRRGDAYHHVLLVSGAKHGDGKTKWLVLGFAAQARLVDESSLQALPLGDSPKKGQPVWVAWRGEMVPARVTSVEPPGLLAVRRDRLAASLWVGPDLVMPPR